LALAQSTRGTITKFEEEVEPWTGDINLHVVKKTQNSSSLSEIPGPRSLRSKKRRRSAIAASSKNHVVHGHLNLDKMQVSGVVSLKMNAVHSSVALHEIARA
jgi:hypothetical protein